MARVLIVDDRPDLRLMEGNMPGAQVMASASGPE